MIIYCKTKDSSWTVGEMLCSANFVVNSGQFWLVKDEGDFCSIEINSKAHCVAVLYSIGESIIGIEVDDNCSSKVIEPLLKKYGFEKVKWVLSK